MKCENNAVTPTTIKAIEYSLRQLARHSKIYDLEDLKRHVAARTGQKETPATVVENETQEKKEETSSVTEDKSSREQPSSEQSEKVEEKKEQNPEPQAESKAEPEETV